ncbi:MAG: undecaprenyl/decaprenyl-phosphate alpha-N-acetylglucosaminyl 1-phosphate transferase [Candidatus Nitrohelix vancouverensis]|uniref:Undecaprenyl/decaprenyl-phosphate alpha-N-acetylglucosaminyl 1-phosphate transferase n=1 Tax=Candidatus Nitrohelix vancouverensis TaxID=2705534 RepID=A0A7T0C2H8_9BACT|nr:MAG: undecaprenyl/decaprenyl-phosphate alpha-N-acetylglucosaminyl 1-phosphate transferase [Candidatus Nitrohelix vancouverensis]
MTFFSQPIPGFVYLSGYIIAFALSLFFTWSIIKLADENLFFQNLFERAMALTDKKVNPFGGIAVTFSLIGSMWILFGSGFLPKENLILFLVITVGVSLMMTLGVLDDIYHLPPRFKLFAQTGIAFIMYASGFQIESIGGLIQLNHFSIVLTLLWIVGITNAINLIDGIDGLAGGVIFLSCLTLSIVYLERGIPEAAFLAVILGGSVLGFALSNFPPAKIILGDTGSLPLGLMVSLITLLPLNQGYTDEIYYLVPLITLLLPIVDTTFAFFRRIFKGVSPFSKDAEHLHHRLEKLGMSTVKAILILLGACLCFNLSALGVVYNIDILSNMVPKYLAFITLSVLVLVLSLRFAENKKRNGK